MTESIPILFSGEMVRAILAGQKTQTRRVVRVPVSVSNRGITHPPMIRRNGAWLNPCEWSPYGVVGGTLWVRETWRTQELDGGLDGVLYAADNQFVPIENKIEAADAWCDAYANGKHGDKWRPSIHMPRWASRITLEVTGISVQRLQETSESDAIAEGIPQRQIDVTYSSEPVTLSSRPPFTYLWDGIYAKRGYSWDSNPWVWVIDFKRGIHNGI